MEGKTVRGGRFINWRASSAAIAIITLLLIALGRVVERMPSFGLDTHYSGHNWDEGWPRQDIGDGSNMTFSSAAIVRDQRQTLQQRRQNLQERLDQIDWSIAASQTELPDSTLRAFWNGVAPYLDSKPIVPIEIHRRPIPLNETLDCSLSAFRERGVTDGSRREAPPRVFDIFPFSYELDVLEMRLYELNETVDYFVLLESTRTHRGTVKPLGYARNEERFERFASKIIHLVMDDADLASYHAPSQDEEYWAIDYSQRVWAVRKVAEALGRFREDDLIIMGDVDEIPYGEAVHTLKWCNTNSAAFPVALGSTHTFRFNFNWILTDYVINVPSVWLGSHVNDALDKSVNFRTAPMKTVFNDMSTHCTTFGDIITTVLKEISISEGVNKPPLGNIRTLSHPFEFEIENIAKGIRLGHPEDRINVVCRQQFIVRFGEDKLPRIPWVVQHNPEHFYKSIQMYSKCPAT